MPNFLGGGEEGGGGCICVKWVPFVKLAFSPGNRALLAAPTFGGSRVWLLQSAPKRANFFRHVADSQIRNEKGKQRKRKFSGRISHGQYGVIRADVQGQNFSQAIKILQKNKHFSADIHDQKARTSMPRGGFTKTTFRKTSKGVNRRG